jgi:peptidyl-prolyl cis-trans isomerase SDCCAG10
VEKVEAEIRKLTRQRHSDSDSDGGKPTKKAKKGPSIIELQNAKYQRGKAAAARRSGKKRDESDVLMALQSFRGRLQQTKGDSGDEEDTKMGGMEGEDGNEKLAANDGEGEEGIEVDDDVDWLRHRLHFVSDGAAESARAEHDYEVIDPRARGAKAKEEEMERKKGRKDVVGGRGYRPPPHGSRR